MNGIGKLAIGLCQAVLIISVAGCAGKPSKTEVEKRVRDSLTAKSAEWKDIRYETRANDAVSVVLANRVVDGKRYEYSFTGGNGSGGVAVRRLGGDWLVKYRFEQEKEVESQKMSGTDNDLKTFRPTATELAVSAIKACP